MATSLKMFSSTPKQFLLFFSIMLWKTFLAWAFLDLCFPFQQAFAIPSISVEIDPRTGTASSSFVMKVTVSDDTGSDSEEPQLEEDSNFSFRSIGSSVNHQIVNGVHSMSTEFHYALQPKRMLAPGRYNTPTGTIEIANQKYAIPTKVLEIVERSAQSADQQENTLVDQVVSTLSPYVGEQVAYQFRVSSINEIVQKQIAPFKPLGVWKEELGERKWLIDQSGKSAVYILPEVFFPLEAGQLVIPERLTEVSFLSKSKRRQRSGIWSPFFDDRLSGLGLMQTVTKQFFATPLQLEVKPLPPPPANTPDYVPVGQLQFRVALDKTEVSQGDNVSLQLQVSGDANLRPLEIPLPVTDDFRTYRDEPKVEATFDGMRVIQKKSFSIALIPLKSGELPAPRLRVVSFEPKDKQYHEYLSPIYKIKVKPSSTNSGLVSAGTSSTSRTEESSKKDVLTLTSDLLPQEQSSEIFKNSRPLSSKTFLGYALMISALGVVFALIMQAFGEYRLNPRKRQRLLAFSEAKSALATVDADSLTFDNLALIFTRYLKNKLGVEEAGFTAQKAFSLVLKASASNDLAQQTKDVFSEIERRRFSGSGGSPQMNSSGDLQPLANKILQTITNLDRAL